MGCDIHTFIEKKIKGRWELVDQGANTRNYELFGRMAGVRGDLEPISKPKGLPEDMSHVTRYYVDDWGDEGHSHSWFNEEEIGKLQDYFNKGDDFYDEFGWSIYDTSEETRIIFWFDN